MFGILLLIVVFVVLGFMYAWVTGVVAREEISVGRGVAILVLAGIASLIFSAFVTDNSYAGAAVNLGMLTLFGRWLAQVEWKHALVIAIVYTVILFAIAMGLASCAN